jgi:hypothetical protein
MLVSKVTMKIHQAISVAALAATTFCSLAQDSTSSDLWDISQGTLITRTSGLLGAGSPAGFFGENGQDFFWEATYSYFLDFQPSGTVHYIEWQTAGDVTLNQVRLFAVGDGPAYNNQREFAQFTLKTKSPGSSDFDVTILTFTPTHPYTFVDPGTYLLLDQAVTPATAREFRAEFLQYDSGTGFDGARIRELDGFGTAGPVLPRIVAQPQSAEVNVGTPAVFSVEANGTGTLNYQWLKDGNPIAGATAATLAIDPVTLGDGGTYTVTVTDDVGSRTSAGASLTINTAQILPSSFDLWNVNNGVSITSASGYLWIGTPYAMFGENGQDIFNESTYTYFMDGAPDGFTHFVEWTTPAPVSIKALRLFAVGDGPDFNNEREFASFTLKTKSAGASDFNVTVATFTPSHPYLMLDGSTWAILDSEVPAVSGQEFRAEFVQFNGFRGFDGPRIMELDAFSSVPEVTPAILVQPASATVVHNSSVTFAVQARGGNLHYQWSLNGVPITEATGPSLTLSKVNNDQRGSYTVSVSNSLGSVQSATATLTVILGKP